MMRKLIWSLLMMLLALPAMARDLSEAERASLHSQIEARSYTLGLIDGGQWYLLRVDDGQQIDILREVYPDFAKAKLPTGSIKEVD